MTAADDPPGAGGGWIPVHDGEDDPPPRTGASHPPGSADPAADRLAREFLRAPEGELREGSLVVRPSLWAALERSVKVLAGLLAFIIPATLAALGLTAETPGPEAGGLLGAVNLWLTIAVPLGAAVAPAIQLAFTRYVLDDEGVRERVQLLSKTERRVPWEKVTALRHRHTILDRVFGIGRVEVVAYGERGATIHLLGLRHPDHLRGLVARRMRASASVDRLLGND